MISPKRGLSLGPDLSLGLDFVTKTAAILAQRRKGKTYTASVLAEELVKCEMPWVALDPTGAWWGLRASADGKHEGLPVVILGGQHGDLPLERSSGRLVADLVLEHPGYYVLDLSMFESKAAERQFAAEFAERLYRRKMQPNMDFPLHLFVDEADMFVPQERESADMAMLGAFQSIVRRGGLHGLGTTLISQRPALVNKSVLTQLDVLILLRLVAGNDIDYVNKNYISRAGSKEQGAELMASMASLALGEAWFWEPGAEPPIFQRVQIRERHTFNSSATPKPGERRVEPTRLADVDLASIKEEMAASIERAQADDPRALRRHIASLERQLAAAEAIEPKVEIREVEVVIAPNMEGFQKVMLALQGALDSLQNKEMSDVFTMMVDIDKASRTAAPTKRLTTPQGLPSAAPFVLRGSPIASYDPASLGRAEKAILSVLAQFPDGRTLIQLGMLSGYSARSGGFNNALGKLRSAGLLNRGQPLIATAEGLEIGKTLSVPLPTGPGLLDFWLGRLAKAERTILDYLVQIWPDTRTKEEIGEVTGYSCTSGGFNNAMGKLRTLELITGRPDIKADDTLGEQFKR